MAQGEQDAISAVEVPFPTHEIAELDAWIAEHGSGLTRPDAIKRIVMRAIAADREWQSAKSSATQQNDGRPEGPDHNTVRANPEG